MKPNQQEIGCMVKFSFVFISRIYSWEVIRKLMKYCNDFFKMDVFAWEYVWMAFTHLFSIFLHIHPFIYSPTFELHFYKLHVVVLMFFRDERIVRFRATTTKKENNRMKKKKKKRKKNVHSVVSLFLQFSHSTLNWFS